MKEHNLLNAVSNIITVLKEKGKEPLLDLDILQSKADIMAHIESFDCYIAAHNLKFCLNKDGRLCIVVKNSVPEDRKKQHVVLSMIPNIAEITFKS